MSFWGLKRPEEEPVALLQRKTGGSPGFAAAESKDLLLRCSTSFLPSANFRNLNRRDCPPGSKESRTHRGAVVTALAHRARQHFLSVDLCSEEICSAISVGVALFTNVSNRHLPRLTHSPHFRPLANAPLGHHSDRSPLAVKRGSSLN